MAILAVAPLFNHLRPRVHGMVDRRLNRSRDDGQHTVESAAASLWLRPTGGDAPMSRFNGSRYDAQQTADAFVQRLPVEVDLDEVSRGLVGAERFSRRLRDTAEIGDVSADLLRLIDRTVQPASITIWMRGQP